MGGSFPWRGSSSHLIGFGRFGNLGGGPRGGAGGGGPPVSFCICCRTGAVVPSRFLVGKAQVSILLTEDGNLRVVTGSECSVLGATGRLFETIDRILVLQYRTFCCSELTIYFLPFLFRSVRYDQLGVTRHDTEDLM